MKSVLVLCVLVQGCVGGGFRWADFTDYLTGDGKIAEAAIVGVPESHSAWSGGGEIIRVRAATPPGGKLANITPDEIKVIMRRGKKGEFSLGGTDYKVIRDNLYVENRWVMDGLGQSSAGEDVGACVAQTKTVLIFVVGRPGVSASQLNRKVNYIQHILIGMGY